MTDCSKSAHETCYHWTWQCRMHADWMTLIGTVSNTLKLWV